MSAPANSHYENFPVASWLCPARLRPAVTAIYWFARTADDIADEGTADAHQRLNDLAAYRSEWQATVMGRHVPAARWTEVMNPLHAAQRSFGLPQQLLLDLLDAFEQDVLKTRARSGYADQAELLGYCRRSANPIGRMLLHLYGIDDRLALERSDCICSALQLINFWQDLSVDIPRQRYYLPEDACFAHGVTQGQIEARRDDERTQSLIRSLADQARALMLRGAPLVHQIPGRAGWELRLVVQGGLRILDHIAAQQFRTLRQRPRLRALDAPVMLWRSLWM